MSLYYRARLSDFAHAVSSYTGCLVESARPVKICAKCLPHKRRLLESYEVMKKKITVNLDEENGIQIDQTCVEVFHGKDSLDIVDDIYDNAVGQRSLWIKGACSCKK